MSEDPIGKQHSDKGKAAALLVEPAFVLLFSIRLKDNFKGFGALPEGFLPLPPEQSVDYIRRLAKFETRLLGETFHKAGRLVRSPLGRIALEAVQDAAPSFADVYLLAHKSGVALWEVYLPAPAQLFDATQWIGWLRADAKDSLIAQLRRSLAQVNHEITGKSELSGVYFPLILLRTHQYTLKTLVEQHGTEMIHMLFLDRSHRPFKHEFVAEELSRDYCSREGGKTLLSRRSGLDIHGCEDFSGESLSTGIMPENAMPFLITIELLLIERSILARLYQRLSRHMPDSVEELLTLKQEVLDELEEYYGAITNATRFSDRVTTDGERLLGLGDLYDAVMDRLDNVSFTITTRYEKRLTLLGAWLTIVFGAAEIGFIAASIATWYYSTGLSTVLAWTVGASVVSGITLALLLWGKLQ